MGRRLYIYSVVLVSLLSFPALGQLQVLPTEGKLLGFVAAPEPGKWLVISREEFWPVPATVLDGGKAVVFEGKAGKYGVFYFGASDAQYVFEAVILGETPTPPPPNQKWQVAFFVETAGLDTMPAAQVEMVSGLSFRKTLAKNGHVFVGTWDKDSSSARPANKYAAWWAAIAGDPMPRVAIAPVAGGKVQDFPLPADAAALEKLLAEATP